jgi:hypothetical protein
VVKVSNLYKSKIYSPERTIQAKVSFEILDVEAYEDASIAVSDEAEISRLAQSINKNRLMSNKYATFERDYFKLDGTFRIPPKENEGDSELGWWTNALSGKDGIFARRPVIQFDFTEPHSSIGLTVTFDVLTNEYASDIIIQAYTPTGEVLANDYISGIKSPVYYYEKPLEGYSKLIITIVRWVKPDRRARIVEVDFGVVREYSGDKLISLKVLEEMDLLASTVPSNEMQFVLDNQDQAFNILNPNGIYRFLVPNQEMTAQIGLLIGESKFEWIPMGKYFLTEWTVEEGAMTSTFVGRDIFTALDLIEYDNAERDTYLYDLASSVLNHAGVKNFRIDHSLETIPTIGFKEKVTCREALQLIAIAGKCVVRQDRSGAVVFERYEELEIETGFITFTGQELAGPSTYPQVYIDYGFQAITFDNAFEVPKIALSQQVTKLVFKIYNPDDTVTDYTIYNAMVKEGVGYEINNPLINNEAQALEVADWMIRSYNYIAEYQASWRQNPALETGTIILIEDNFGRKKKARITKSEFNFAGYLDGLTEAKGGI